MLSVLSNRTYRHLFAAQVIALIGTGLLTVALGLLAFKLAGDRAGTVLGTALAIKMVAYVLIAPVAQAFTSRLPRRAFLVGTDLVRAAIALTLPFVDQVWQIYALIFVLQSASAAFTPTFQATIPDILPDERDYTRALSLSRLAYDLENLLSPTLAALLLAVVPYNALFGGAVVGFLCSAALVVSVSLPIATRTERQGGIYDRTTRGLRIYLATPRLRGLLARAGVMSRVALTPEGTPLPDALAAIDVLVREDVRLLSISFHSPSVEPGHTPYVRDAADLARFWAWWDGVLARLSRHGYRAIGAEALVAAAWASRDVGLSLASRAAPT